MYGWVLPGRRHYDNNQLFRLVRLSGMRADSGLEVVVLFASEGPIQRGDGPDGCAIDRRH